MRERWPFRIIIAPKTVKSSSFKCTPSKMSSNWCYRNINGGWRLKNIGSKGEYKTNFKLVCSLRFHGMLLPSLLSFLWGQCSQLELDGRYIEAGIWLQSLCPCLVSSTQGQCLCWLNLPLHLWVQGKGCAKLKSQKQAMSFGLPQLNSSRWGSSPSRTI